MYQVILYYNFCSLDDPESFCQAHKAKCEELNLKGRIYISQEGINGTLSGLNKDVEAYKTYLRSQTGFEPTQFKVDHADSCPFFKLICKLRPEIVALKTDMQGSPVKPYEDTYMEPKEWRQTLESDEDIHLIDVRNNYESKIGHFEGAICPDVENFYDFPEWLDKAQLEKDKKVLMYCTGGIRCEKFAIYMKEQGYDQVKQLHGGIIRYAQEEQGKHFKGKCFVFDDRMVVPINKDEEPIAHCEISGEPCDMYINCANVDCNRLFICTKEAATKMDGCCCEECRTQGRRRPFNPDDVYAPFRKWYHYYEDKEFNKPVVNYKKGE